VRATSSSPLRSLLAAGALLLFLDRCQLVLQGRASGIDFSLVLIKDHLRLLVVELRGLFHIHLQINAELGCFFTARNLQVLFGQEVNPLAVRRRDRPALGTLDRGLDSLGFIKQALSSQRTHLAIQHRDVSVDVPLTGLREPLRGKLNGLVVLRDELGPPLLMTATQV